MWLPLQMYFPFPVSRKIFLLGIFFLSTFWSMVPIKCHASVPHQITNIYSLMPVTVMVCLCVNTAATVCYSLWLLGCFGDWSVDVVCDDVRKTFWNVTPLAGVWYMIDNQLRDDQLCLFFAYRNWTTLGTLSGKCYGTKDCTVMWLCVSTLLCFVTFSDSYLLDRL